MNKKIVTVYLLMSLCFGASAAPSRTAEVTSVRNASQFAIGGIGLIGVISEPEKSLHALLGQPEAARGFVALLRTSTREGQMYALLGLKLTDKRRFAQEEKRYLRVRRRVVLQAADVVLSVPASFIVRKIAHGDYDTRLMQD